MKITLLIILLFSQWALGVEEGAETSLAAGSFPLGTIISQLANFSILILILYFSQRKTVSNYFVDKRKAFVDQVEAASNSKKEAEELLGEVKTRLEELENSFEKQVEEAKGNADEMYRTQLADAKNEALRIQELTKTSLEYETLREIEKLRLEAFEKSSKLAEKNIETKMTADQQKAWNNHFVQNVKGAH